MVAFGILFIIFGVICLTCSRDDANLIRDMQYMPTSTIKDATDILQNLGVTNDYRHYVELKGMLQSEQEQIAPFSGRPAAYYSNISFSIQTVPYTTTDKNGNIQDRTKKVKTKFSSTESSMDVYMTDGSCEQKVYVDVQSFGTDAKLMQACNRFETADSPWMKGNASMFSFPEHLTGYELKESILPQNTAIYVLGELYRLGDKILIEKAIKGKNKSILSYKKEEEVLKNTKSSKSTLLVFGIILIVLGVIFCFSG